MTDRFSKTISLLRLELGLSYRFPVIEGISVLVFLMIFMNSMVGSRHIHFDVGDIAWYADQLRRILPQMLYISLLPIVNLIAFLVPILVAIAVARPFEEEYYRTLLTYPTSRFFVLVTKIILVGFIPATIVSTALMFAIWLVYPAYPSTSILILIVGSIYLFMFLQSSLSTLMAVISKRMSATAILGVGFWFSMNSVLGLEGISPIATAICNPIVATLRYLVPLPEQIGIEVLLTGFVGSAIISFALVVIAILVFRRAEL